MRVPEYAAALATLSACSHGAGVGVIVEGAEERADAQFAELAVYKGPCPDGPTLLTGKAAGPVYRQDIDVMSNFAAVGKLPAGVYGFAVLLRDDTCQIVAGGCTSADLERVDTVTVVVGQVFDPNGSSACTGGDQCNEGVCSSGAGG